MPKSPHVVRSQKLIATIFKINTHGHGYLPYLALNLEFRKDDRYCYATSPPVHKKGRNMFLVNILQLLMDTKALYQFIELACAENTFESNRIRPLFALYHNDGSCVAAVDLS